MGTKQTKGQEPGGASPQHSWKRTPTKERGDILASLMLKSGDRMNRGGTPPPYQRRIGMIQEMMLMAKQGKQDEATEMLKTLRQEGDSLGAMEKVCRQLTYHLSPHSQWRRQGLLKRKPQACLKAVLMAPLSSGALDLSGIPLTARDMERLCAHLQRHASTLVSLELGFTELTDEAFLLLLPTLAVLPHLETLALNGNRLTRTILKELTDALKPFLVSLRKRCPKQGNLPTILEFGESQASEPPERLRGLGEEEETDDTNRTESMGELRSEVEEELDGEMEIEEMMEELLDFDREVQGKEDEDDSMWTLEEQRKVGRRRGRRGEDGREKEAQSREQRTGRRAMMVEDEDDTHSRSSRLSCSSQSQHSSGALEPMKAEEDDLDEVLFGTPIYERALRLCWHSPSYKSMIALMTQLLRLQQNNQLPAEVTAANMSELLVEQSKETLRVQLWEFELEGYDDDVRPLLQLVWEVNNAMKMRDVEYEARRLLSSPEAVPPRFQHPNIISQALEYAVILKEQQEKGPRSELLSPMEVVLQVLPKVLQGFWVPPPNTCFSMPSQQLSPMAVGITKAVQDRVSKTLSTVLLQATFSSTTRDNMTLSIQEKVRQGYSQDVLEKGLNSFAAEVLNTITDVAVREVCALFQPLISEAVETATDEPPARTASQEPDSAVVCTPPCALTVTDEPPASPEPDSAVGSTPCALTVTDEPPASPEPDSAVGSTPCALAVTDEPPASPEPDSAVGSTPCALAVTDEPPASPEPDSAVGSTPCALAVTDEPPASPEPDSAVGSTPCALAVTDEPPASPEPDSAAGSTPCALAVTDEPPASPEPDSAAGSTPCALAVTDEPPASPEPDSAAGSTPCALAVTDEPPASPEPDSAAGSTPCALAVTDEPPASPEPDSAAGSTPCALAVTDEPPASPEPDSAAGSTPCALTVTDEPPASPEPDSAAGSTPCALTVTDEPPASPEPDSAAGSTPCALTVTDEPPASPEPDSAAGSTPCALTVTDEPPASPEPDSAAGSTPCALTVTDEPPASPEPGSAAGSTPCALTVTDEPPASPEPDSAAGSTPCALTVTNEPPASPEPDSAAGSTPCALTVTDEPQKPVYSFVNYNYNAEARGTNSTKNEAPGLQEENREMISAIITTPPALSAHTAIQNVFNGSLGETDRHEESESVEVSTFSAVKKSKFRGFLNWLKKHCCCCLLSGDNEVD
ncbi:Leucine-rich repeat-containing protein 75A [Nibea albiflora]|uniref:Leucine-rich repeat-containing protein 75A n=1 Tax=Nibea albiflora TaxID=240163 RepID=A0ACB7EN26_NIBAL|nr:Leucine-rich repeat-containing protein 75A [Nibea albiflora]